MNAWELRDVMLLRLSTPQVGDRRRLTVPKGPRTIEDIRKLFRSDPEPQRHPERHRQFMELGDES